MKDYQLQTLQWMLDHESMRNGLNGLFWEHWCWSDGGGFYYFPAAGELRIERPPMIHGGLLCEEMGLGKTLEIIAVILHSKLQDDMIDDQVDMNKMGKQHQQEHQDVPASTSTSSSASTTADAKQPTTEMVETKTTLIIVPQTLLGQWMNEIQRSTLPGTLSVAAHTQKLDGKWDVDRGDHPSHQHLDAWHRLNERRKELTMQYDIVVTTYQMLKSDRLTFSKVKWKRICVDEMQFLRSSTTELARLCKNLISDRRWMISGTPLYTSIDDLNGELNFLSVQPFCLADQQDGFWGRRIKTPWSLRDPSARQLLKVLLKGIMIRHSKGQRTIEGRPLLELPKSTHRFVGINFDDDSRGRANLYVAARMESLLCDAIDQLKTTASYVSTSTESRRVTNNGRVVMLLKLVRAAYISLNLVNGGCGCASQLGDLDRLFRRSIHAGASSIFGMSQGGYQYSRCVCCQVRGYHLNESRAGNGGAHTLATTHAKRRGYS